MDTLEQFDRDDRVAPLPVMPHTRYMHGNGTDWHCQYCNKKLASVSEVCKCTQAADEPALRFDAGKTEYADFETYVDPGFIQEIGRAFRYGAKKYGRDNWKKGMSWSRCFNSLRRHLYAWWRGETIDEESGCHHLVLATCSIMFLYVYERDNTGKDDR